MIYLPAAAVAESDGSFTNTQRLLQQHEKAADPPDDARSDIWYTVHLGLRLKRLYADSREEKDKPIKALVWDYLDPAENAEWRIKDEPSVHRILKEINGFWTSGANRGKPVASFADLKDDGSDRLRSMDLLGRPGSHRGRTGWPQQGGEPDERDEWVSLGWGFAWPANRRLMYNCCSADLAGQPWPKEARLARAFRPAGSSGTRLRLLVLVASQRDGLDVPDFPATKPPTRVRGPSAPASASRRKDGCSPFIMKADGKGWLFVPSGLLDGPLPTHYEPSESPVRNIVYPEQQNNPVMLTWNVRGNPMAAVGSPDYPHVVTTYRLTEHHLTGVMSRWLPWLVELQPEMFCELSPEHAAELGVKSTDWVVISTPRASIRAKALVTSRLRPFKLRDKTVHQVGLPMHWGYNGVCKGDIANDLCSLVADPNVSIHEAKAFLCQVRKA